MKPKPLVWPPKVGERIHYFVAPTKRHSWSAEVRSIVDDDYMVIRKWSVRTGWRYEIIDRYWVEVSNEGTPRFFHGPLPKRKS